MATLKDANPLDGSVSEILSQRKGKKYNLNKHCLHLGGVMNKYRRSGSFCDVKLVVQDTEFNAHRVVLAGCESSYFYNLFTIEMKEKQEGVVYIQGELESEIMEEFLQFIYTGKVTLTSQNTVELLKAANYTNVPGLKSLCQDFLNENLTVEQCFNVRNLAEMYDCPQLVQACNSFMKAHFTEVAKLPEFLDISESELKSYLASDDIVVKGEEEVYETLIRWVRHEPETRKKHFYKLFCCIRLRSLSNHYLMTTVAEEDLVCGEPLCLKLAFKTMPSPNSSHKPRKCIDSFLDAIVMCGGDDYDLDVNDECVCFVPSTNKWHKLASFCGGPTIHHGSAESDGFLYVMGGQGDYGMSDQSSAYRYDPVLNKWLCVAPMLKAVSRVGVVALMGFVYTVGGDSIDGTSAVVQRYDPTTNSWQLVEPLSTPRESACVVSDHQFLYAIGGFQMFPEEEILNSCEKYDPRANKWVSVPSMDTKKKYAVAVVCNDKIFVLGGETDNLDAYNFTSSCEMYNISSETWSDIIPLQEPRAFATAAVISGQIYLLGGRGEEHDYLDAIERYNVNSNRWEVVLYAPRSKYRLPSSVLRFTKKFLKECPQMEIEEDD